MAMAQEITLSQLYSCEEDLEKAVVLKDLPNNSDDLDFLTNYLDVVIGEDGNLVKVCQPIPIPSALIAIFDQVIPDVEKYRVTLDKRKCKGKRIILEKIGQLAGVFLSNVPTNVDDDFLLLYFESKKKCGYECEVSNINVKVNDVNSVAIVAISDVTAVRGILAQPVRSMRNNDVTLEPYFPAYHDYLLGHLPGSIQTKQSEAPEKSSALGNLVIIDSADGEGDQREQLDVKGIESENQIVEDINLSQHLVNDSNPPSCDFARAGSTHSTLIRDENESHKGNFTAFKANSSDVDEDIDCDVDNLVKFDNDFSTSDDDNAAAAADDDDDDDDDDDGDNNDDEVDHDKDKKHIEEKENFNSEKSPSNELYTGSLPAKPQISTYEKSQNELFPNQTENSICKPDVTKSQSSPYSVENVYETPCCQPVKPVRLFDCIVDEHDRNDIRPTVSDPLLQDQKFENKLTKNDTQFQETSYETFFQRNNDESAYENRSHFHHHDAMPTQNKPNDTRDSNQPIFINRHIDNTTNTAAKPVVAMVKPSISKENPNKGRAPIPPKSQAQSIETELSVPASKIVLLKITKYKSLNQYKNVRIFLHDRQGNIVIKGSSNEYVNEEKLRIYETLNQMVERTATLSSKRCEFLGQKECLDHIKFICKKNGLKVVMTVNSKNVQLVCLALTDDEAQGGLKLVQDRIHTQSVKLRQGQIDILTGPKWQQFLDNLKTSLTIVYISEKKDEIKIEGFKKVSEIAEDREKVVQFLKDNVVKVTPKIELNGAKAKCFDQYLKQDLMHAVQQKHGKLTVDVIKKDYPMKVSLSIHGEASVVNHANSVLQQIWHEKFDFTKISSDKLDFWLIMSGLSGQHGKPFFRKFEQDHSCCIDVTEAGQVPPPSIEVKHHDVSQPSEPLSYENYSTSSPYKGDTSEVYGFYKRRSRPSYGHLQQDDMTDDEALQMAMAMSRQNNCINQEVDDLGVIGSSYDEPEEEEDWEPVFPTRPLPPTPSYGDSGSDDDLDDFVDEESDDDDVVEKKISIKIGNADVTLEIGEISKYQADCIVNFVGSSWKLEEGTVSKGILKAAGPQLSQDYQSKIQTPGGKYVETVAGNLNCQSVFHVQLTRGPQNCTQAVQSAVVQALNICARNGYTSIVFPPLGLGRMYQYPAATVAKSMLGGIQASSNNFNDVKITIVVFDEKTFSQFRTEFQKGHGNQQTQISTSFLGNNQPSRRPIQYGKGPVYQVPPKPRRAFPQPRQNVPPPRQVVPQPSHAFAPLKRAMRSSQLNLMPDADNTPHRSLHPQQPGYGGVTRQRRIFSSYVLDSPSRGRKQAERMKHSKSMDDIKNQEKDRREHHKVQKPEPVSTRKEQKHEPRYRKDAPAKHLNVTIFAVNEDKCIKARNALCKAINDEFLFKESLKKAAHINDETKMKILQVVTKYQVKSIPGKDCYFIKGHQESVNKAIKEIYEILFDAGTQSASSTQEKRKRRTGMKRETKEYVKFMVEEEPDVPDYWKNFKPGNPIKSALLDIRMAISGKKYKKVTLDAEDRVYKKIIKMINTTWEGQKKGQGKDAVGLDQCNYSKLFVTKIERIENLDLYHNYASRRTKFFSHLFSQQRARYPEISKLPGCSQPIQSFVNAGSPLSQDMNPEINEFYFFHGTKPDNVPIICDQGLDNRLASGQAMFGPGIYGAETCTKADQYADDKNNKRACGQGNPLKMFLIRIILGDAFICKDTNPHKYKRAPCRECYADGCKKHRGLFDSVIGDCGKLFREFVVYSRDQCYPEYLITYERR